MLVLDDSLLFRIERAPVGAMQGAKPVPQRLNLLAMAVVEMLADGQVKLGIGERLRQYLQVPLELGQAH